jgi:ABC-type multidrug transport system fused ATPase/permease subunit
MLISIFIIKNTYLALLIYLQGLLIKKIRSNLSEKVFKLYLNAPFKLYYEKNPAYILRNIMSETSQTVSLLFQAINLFKEIIILLTIFFLLIYVDTLVSFSVFFIFTLFVGLFFFYTRKIIGKNGKILQKFTALKTKDINEAFGAIKEVKIFNKEKILERNFNEKIGIWEKSYLINYFLTSLPRLVLEAIVILIVVSIVIIFLFIDRDLNTIIPLLSLLIVSAARMLPSFNTISTALASIKGLSPSYKLMIDEIRNLEQIKFVKKEYDGSKFPFTKNLYFKDIDFKYDEDQKSALLNLNIKINAGSKVGIIGKSGSGKSTFIDVILGLLEPNKGEILVDGINIKQNIIGWQSQIGYVPQDVYLLDDTIKNNIIFSSNEKKTDLKKLNKIITTCNLDELVKNSEKGLETLVGDRGARLSGGQKQRIGIARALYKNPKIIIFDEATSSLDIQNENKIIDEIFNIDRSKTLILVTHRHQVVKNCDIIFLFENGKIIDQGTYEYLFKKHNFQ